jgi:Domain of unknown function (DUF1835)
MQLDEAVHLVHGDAAAQALLQLGARTVRVRRDLLTVGPCDIDPVKHRAARHAFWGRAPEMPTALPGVDDDAELARELAGGAPVVLWASGAWSDLTFLWALVDALARLGAERPFLARPRADDPTLPMGGIEGARLLAAWQSVEPLREELARSCVIFWQAYAQPSPLEFDDLRQRALALAPAQAKIFEGHTAWFPWRDGRPADADTAIARGDDSIMRWIGDGMFERRRENPGGPWWIGGCALDGSFVREPNGAIASK